MKSLSILKKSNSQFMKKGNNILAGILWFLAGSLVCYITLQFSFFEIDYEFKVVETLVSIGTAIIALYIAITIQRKLTKNQNQYTYIERKIDTLWASFNNFSLSVVFSDNIEVDSVSKYTKEARHSISFVKNIFSSYDLKNECISVLEKNIDDFEEYILKLPIAENIISLSDKKTDIQSKVLEINQSFSAILKFIQTM